jgi:cytochrome c oxidase subunit 3
MNPSVILKSTGNGADAFGGAQASGRYRALRGPAAGIGLWVFMGVAGMLFSLFIAAYVMRMSSADWYAIGMPWQLWLSTALLIAGSLALQLASAAAAKGEWEQVRSLMLAGGACALAFLGAQSWAWQALLALQVMPSGNPAASFFYLLTAMHGLHVAGGLVGWALTARRAFGSDPSHDAVRLAWSVRLCARYWHFLLAVWVALFATLGGLTPEVVRFICGAP